jgi:hypothetical protein
VCRVSCLAVLGCSLLPVFLMRTGHYIHVVFVLELTLLLYCIFVYTVFPACNKRKEILHWDRPLMSMFKENYF